MPIIQIQETFGAHPNAALEVIDEGAKIRVRVREPHAKASIFLTPVEVRALAGSLGEFLSRTTVVDAARALVKARDERQERAGMASAMSIAAGPEYAILAAAVRRHDEMAAAGPHDPPESGARIAPEVLP